MIRKLWLSMRLLGVRKGLSLYNSMRSPTKPSQNWERYTSSERTNTVTITLDLDIGGPLTLMHFKDICGLFGTVKIVTPSQVFTISDTQLGIVSRSSTSPSQEKVQTTGPNDDASTCNECGNNIVEFMHEKNCSILQDEYDYYDAQLSRGAYPEHDSAWANVIYG